MAVYYYCPNFSNIYQLIILGSVRLCDQWPPYKKNCCDNVLCIFSFIIIFWEKISVQFYSNDKTISKWAGRETLFSMLTLLNEVSSKILTLSYWVLWLLAVLSFVCDILMTSPNHKRKHLLIQILCFVFQDVLCRLVTQSNKTLSLRHYPGFPHSTSFECMSSTASWRRPAVEGPIAEMPAIFSS